MILGALIGLGLDHERLSRVLLPVAGAEFTLGVEQVSIHGVAANRVTVEVASEPHHRTLNDVEALLDRGALSSAVLGRVKAVFRRLADAEARIHRSTPERVHFHEVGATDAIIDIVGACWGFEQLRIEAILCAPLVLGSGLGRSAHGPIIYPAPAVLEILRGRPVRFEQGLGETTTPTGAAILAEVAQFVDDAMLTPEAVGYGAGHREIDDRPNLLRVTLGVAPEVYDTDRLWLAASDVDNTRPEVFDWLADRLRSVGAIDVMFSGVSMKKGRRGIRVEALCTSECRARVAELILAETGSLGVRWHPVTRTKLPRRTEMIDTPWGPIAIKIASAPTGERGIPEYEDCRRAAEISGEPLIAIIDAVTALYVQRRRQGDSLLGGE